MNRCQAFGVWAVFGSREVVIIDYHLDTLHPKQLTVGSRLSGKTSSSILPSHDHGTFAF